MDRPGATATLAHKGVMVSVPPDPSLHTFTLAKADKAGKSATNPAGTMRGPQPTKQQSKKAKKIRPSAGTASSGKMAANEGPDTALAMMSGRIEYAHGEVLGHARRTAEAAREVVHYAIEAGEWLARAKEALPHGKFQAWVKKQCSISPSTARDYMILYKKKKEVEREFNSKRRPADVLTVKKILRYLASPRRADETRRKAEPSPSEPGGVSHAAAQPRPEGAADDHDNSDDAAESGHVVAGVDSASAHTGHPSREVGTGIDDEADNDNEPDGDDARVDADRRQPHDPESATAGRTSGPAHRSVSMDDVAWLASLPVRSRLTDTTIFDQQALIWLQVQPAIDLLHQLFQPSEEDIRKSRVKSWLRERYSYRLASFVGVRHPREWGICRLCHGSGVSGALKKECDACKAGGFEVSDASDTPVDDRDDHTDTD